MMLRPLFVLFVISVCAFECYKNETNHEKKSDRIVKKVGKSMERQVIALTVMKTEPHPEWVMKSYNMPLRIHTSYHQDKKAMEEWKTVVARQITKKLRYSFSNQDETWEVDSKTIMMYTLDDMTAKVCGSDQKMNKYQFFQYLKRNRQIYKKWGSNYDYKFTILPTPNDSFSIVTPFEMETTMGYKETTIFQINLALDVMDNDIYEPYLVYNIISIVIGGGCTEHGIIDHKYTEYGRRGGEMEHLKKDKNPDVKYLFDLFTPPTYREVEQINYTIPNAFLEGLDKEDSKLELNVCDENKDHKMQRYTREQFLEWWHRFNQMWHPNGTDYLQFQIIDLVPNKIIARVTMRLQIGVRPESPSFEWNLKIVANYGERGDNTWYLTRVDVMCHPMFNYMDESLITIRDVVTEDFMKIVRKNPHPYHYYGTLDFMKRFTHGEVDTIRCDLETHENLTKIEFPMLFYNLVKNFSMSHYDIDRDDIPIPAEKVSYFILHTIIKPFRPCGAWYGWYYYQDWRFGITWDYLTQFYYITNLYVSCRTSYDIDPKYARVTDMLRFGR